LLRIIFTMTSKLIRWLPIACALLPLAALGAPPAAIKLTSQLSTFLDMSVEINGVKGWLTVDSGATSTCLDKSLAQDLKVPLKRGQGESEGVGGRSNQELGEITVRVPGHQPKDFPNLSGKHDFIPLGGETTATSLGRNLGVIGLSELMAAGAIIDCAGSRLILHPEGKFHRPQKGLELTMLRYAANSKTLFKLSRALKSIDELEIKGGFLWAIPVKIANKAGVMIVDTGCESTIVTQAFAKLVGIEPVGEGASVHGAGAGSQRMASCALPDLLLDGKLQLGKIQGLCDGSKFGLYGLNDVAGGDLPVVGILGLDQLKRSKAFVDCKRGVIYTTGKPLKPERPNSWTVDGPKAIECLANAGDKEAIKLIEKHEKGGATLHLKQATKFIERAVQKGLLK
jgi:Aspartyl protease